MTLALDIPDLLDFPDKLLPLITEFNKYKYFLIDGGRVSAKSQSVGRLLLDVGEKKKVRICCGREIQANIDESVYTLLKDLIVDKDLHWDVKSKNLDHLSSGSSIIFKGFREQGKLNIKGLEGVDILWIDEAQGITKPTLQVIIPTIRKSKAKVFFTMNRLLSDDPVYVEFAKRQDCLHIHINYNENKHCPAESKIEAENMRTVDIDSYNHVWLGQPMENASNFIFPDALIQHAVARFDTMSIGRGINNSGVAVDPSGMGADDNEFLAVNEGLPLESYSKTIMSPTEKALKAVEMCKRIDGYWIIVDCDGIGADTYLELASMDENFLAGIQLIKFNGSSPSKVSLTTTLRQNRPVYANMRAEIAYVAQKSAYAGLASINPRHKHLIEDLKHDVAFVNRQGLLQLIEKKDIKEQIKRSPGKGDVWKMAQYACALNLQDQRFQAGRQPEMQRTADDNFTNTGQESVSRLQQTAD
jgi:phage terminase large subunit